MSDKPKLIPEDLYHNAMNALRHEQAKVAALRIMVRQLKGRVSDRDRAISRQTEANTCSRCRQSRDSQGRCMCGK